MVEAAADAEVRVLRTWVCWPAMFYFAARPNIFKIERGALDPPAVRLRNAVINETSQGRRHFHFITVTLDMLALGLIAPVWKSELRSQGSMRASLGK